MADVIQTSQRLAHLVHNLEKGIDAKYRRLISIRLAKKDKAIKEIIANTQVEIQKNPKRKAQILKDRELRIKAQDSQFKEYLEKAKSRIKREKAITAEELKKAAKKRAEAIKGRREKNKYGKVSKTLKTGKTLAKNVGKSAVQTWKSIPGKKTIFGTAALLSAAVIAATLKRYSDLEKERDKKAEALRKSL